MERLLVVGASGLLGSKFYDSGVAEYEVYGTYETHKIVGNNIFHLDVTDRSSVIKLVQKIKPDVIIDTHVLHNVDYCELNREECWTVNVDRT